MPADKKPADPLHKPLVKWWCEEAYKNKYGTTYMFKFAQEGKLLKSALSWFRKEAPQETEETFKKSAHSFLRDTDKYLEANHHPFSLFLSKPHKWVGKAKSRPQPPATKGMFDLQLDKGRLENRWGELNHEEFISKVINLASDHPIQFFRGYVETQGSLRQRNEELWRKTSRALAELVGIERARRIWKEDRGILKEMK